MKNNTKIRLHLSRQLFESLTKQVVQESKNMSGGAYTEAVKAKKGSAMKSKMEGSAMKGKMGKMNEMEVNVAEDDAMQDKVQITLDEYIGAEPWEYTLGKWAFENYPTIANALSSAAPGVDKGQIIADLGGTIVALAATGSIFASAYLAVAKDDIKAAAKKLVAKIKGKMNEMDGEMGSESDPALDKVVAQLPADIKAKIAKK